LKDTESNGRLGRRLNLMSYAGLGIELAGILAVLVGIGWWLDEKFATSPWLTLSGATFGILGCLCKVWLLWRRMYSS